VRLSYRRLLRILTIVGTRPEIIRLSRLIPELDRYSEHLLVHTGQNYTKELSDVFFNELGVRAPDEHLGVQSAVFAQQVSRIIERVDAVMERFRPDRVLILGDTNSGLAALAAARRGVPVFHLEAGNRCYDDRVPEETNRRVIDHCSSILMPYTQRSMENLVREGIDRDRIFVVGNPIYEVLAAFSAGIDASSIQQRLGLTPHGYLLATVHRAENVDLPERLTSLVTALHRVSEDTALPLVASVHPRTAQRLKESGLSSTSPDVRLLEPLGFFDFVRLEREAACVLTDSGTVQEECAILHVPNVTIRDVTERPETVEVGSNVVTGAEPADIVAAVRLARGLGTDWIAPDEYLVARASVAIAKIVLGRLSLRRHFS
jgi:UDP-N-acetylglucosamine 2-epimerase (non-hydrolysing)